MEGKRRGREVGERKTGKKEGRKEVRKSGSHLYLPVYQEGKSFPRVPTTKFPLGLTVQSWAHFHLNKSRVLLERKMGNRYKASQNIAFMASVPMS